MQEQIHFKKLFGTSEDSSYVFRCKHACVCGIELRDKYIYPFKDRTELIKYITDKKKILIVINAEKILKELEDRNCTVKLNVNEDNFDNSKGGNL